jgi:hypothetical protein
MEAMRGELAWREERLVLVGFEDIVFVFVSVSE